MPEEEKKKKKYKSPYERKFGKKHPNNPAERKRKEAEAKPPEKPKDSTPAKGDKNPKTVKALKIAGAVADAVGTFAGQMSAAHKESWKGVNPRATKVRGGEGSTYNYQPKKMTDKPGDTSPMIRYDSDYEKKKKSLGL